MANPNPKINIDNLRTPTSEEAKAMQKESAKAKKRNNIMKRAALETVTDEKAQEMIAAAMNKALDGDERCIRLIWEILGEKIDKTEISVEDDTLNAAIKMTAEEKYKRIQEIMNSKK